MPNTETKVGMPLHDFLAEAHQQPFDLINGERKYLLPHLYGHDKTVRILLFAIIAFLTGRKLGEVFSETTFILPDKVDSNWVKGSRTPDIMFFTGNRLADYEAEHPDHRERPLALIPDFVIEVVSPNDSFSDIDEKIDAYLKDGVRLIWLIDPQRRKAIIYEAGKDQPFHMAADGKLDGKDILPGFTVQLSELFN